MTGKTMRPLAFVLPNTITLCAMAFGFRSILASMRGAYTDAALAILVAALLDSLDGCCARLTSGTSRFGKNLDSISDFIGFGIAPAVLFGRELHSAGIVIIGWAVCVFFVCCSGYRLIRYSVQAESVEKRSFTGMPTTAAAIVIAAGFLLYGAGHGAGRMMFAWIWAPVLLGALMISRIRYASAGEFFAGARKGVWLGLLIPVAVFLLLGESGVRVIFGASVLYAFSGPAEELMRRCSFLARPREFSLEEQERGSC